MKPNEFLKDFERRKNEFLKRQDELIRFNLNRLGMELVTHAKENYGFVQQTGNLVNSMGYHLIKDGEIIDSVFEAKERGPKYDPNEPKGEDIGRKWINNNIPENNGYTLIITAGMNYASYVEDVHRLNVLQATAVFSKSLTPKVLQLIINNLRKIKV